jgi:hypothetical protein
MNETKVEFMDLVGRTEKLAKMLALSLISFLQFGIQVVTLFATVWVTTFVMLRRSSEKMNSRIDYQNVKAASLL